MSRLRNFLFAANRPLQDRLAILIASAVAAACAQAGGTVVLLGRKVAPLNRVYDAAKAVGPSASSRWREPAGASVLGTGGSFSCGSRTARGPPFGSLSRSAL